MSAIFRALSLRHSSVAEGAQSGSGREWMEMLIEVMEFMAEGYLP